MMTTRLAIRPARKSRIVANQRIAGVKVMSETEGKAFFDRKVRESLGISGDEFLERWDRGVYKPVDDSDEGRKVGRLVMLIPFARRTNA